MKKSDDKNLNLNNITPTNKKKSFKEDSFNFEGGFESYNKDFSNYSFKSSNNNMNSNDQIYNKQTMPKRPILFRKKLIISNQDKIRNINASNFINEDIEYIRRKIESDEYRERERKIYEWFYINDINIEKRDLYDAFSTLIQSVFRGYLYRKNIEYFIKLNILFNSVYKLYLKFYFKNIFDFIKYRSKNTESLNEDEKINIFKEIKELINQNKELHKKLDIIITENNRLKKENEENDKKFGDLMNKINNFLSLNEENKKLKEEINILKNKEKVGNSSLIDNKDILNNNIKNNIKQENFHIKLLPNITKSNKNKNNYIIVKINNINITPNKK